MVEIRHHSRDDEGSAEQDRERERQRWRDGESRLSTCHQSLPANHPIDLRTTQNTDIIGISRLMLHGAH